MKKRTKGIATGVAMVTLIGTGAGVSIASSGGEPGLSGADAERAAASALEHVGGGTVTETETGDSGAAYSAEVRLDDGTQIEVQLDESFAVIGQEADEDVAGEPEDEVAGSEAESEDEGGDANETDTAITGSYLERASQVALEHLGEGRVTDTEVGDEESYYEIEVTLDDGSQVDVQLDERFNVVSSDPDSRNDG